MNNKNKTTFDKLQNEVIIRLVELETKKKYGNVTINFRIFDGTITNDADISFKETLKIDK